MDYALPSRKGPVLTSIQFVASRAEWKMFWRKESQPNWSRESLARLKIYNAKDGAAITAIPYFHERGPPFSAQCNAVYVWLLLPVFEEDARNAPLHRHTSHLQNTLITHTIPAGIIPDTTIWMISLESSSVRELLPVAYHKLWAKACQMKSRFA
jgi:hypothetical protein